MPLLFSIDDGSDSIFATVILTFKDSLIRCFPISHLKYDKVQNQNKWK